jgi:hypothetical protein
MQPKSTQPEIFTLHGHLRVMPRPQPTHSALARHADHTVVEMDHYSLGMALAMAQITELHRQADRRRLASRIPGRTASRRRDRAPGSQCHPGRPRPAR